MEQVDATKGRAWRLPAISPWLVVCAVFALSAAALFVFNALRYSHETESELRLIPYLRYDTREDFDYFYAGATMAWRGHAADLYPLPGERTYYPREPIFEEPHDEFTLARLMTRGNYFYPPALAYAQAPLASLPFREAYWLFSLLSLAALGGFLALAWREGRHIPETPLLLLGVVAFKPVHETLILGHLALILLLALTAAFLLLRADRQVLAGLALSLLAIKPQWAVLPALFLLVRGRWLAFGTMAVVAALIFFGPFLFTGFKTLDNYYHFLRLSQSIDLKDAPHMFSWNGFLGRLDGSEVQNGQVIYYADAPSRFLIYGLIGLTALPLLVVWWSRDYLLGAAATAVAMLLISTHSVWYDWSLICAAALFLVMRSPAMSRGQRVEMWVVFIGLSIAASQSIAAIIGNDRHDITPLDWHSVQFFSITPLAFVSLLWMASLVARDRLQARGTIQRASV